MEGIILTLVFMGLVIAVITKYSKVGILLSAASTYAYFQVVDFDHWLPIVLFVAGLLLMVVEIFIPDFGLIGILGIGSLVSGLYLTLGDLAQTIEDLSIAIIITACLVVYLLKRGYSLANLNRLVLHSKDDKYKEDTGYESKLEVGSKGIAETTLRPSGKATFGEEDDSLYDVLSTQGHISKGSRLRIEKISGTKISVSKDISKKGD